MWYYKIQIHIKTKYKGLPGGSAAHHAAHMFTYSGVYARNVAKHLKKYVKTLDNVCTVCYTVRVKGRCIFLNNVNEIDNVCTT